MIINNIINNDLDNCYEVLKNDKELSEAEKEFYNLLDRVDNSLQLQIEANYSQFTARAMRIAYLQGFKDFYELCLTMKSDTYNILMKMDNAFNGKRNK